LTGGTRARGAASAALILLVAALLLAVLILMAVFASPEPCFEDLPTGHPDHLVGPSCPP
jgi:hypothetical protein